MRLGKLGNFVSYGVCISLIGWRDQEFSRSARAFTGFLWSYCESSPTLVPFESSSTKRFLSLSMISHFIVACFGEKGPTEWFTVVKS